jgi:hypothetical protein
MIEAPANQVETVASIMFTRSEAMSYTSVSMTRPGKAWDGVEPGSDEWAAMQEKQQAVISEAGGTIVAGGWAVGFNAFINIITYPDIDCSMKVVARLTAANMAEIESSALISPEEWATLIS